MNDYLKYLYQQMINLNKPLQNTTLNNEKAMKTSLLLTLLISIPLFSQTPEENRTKLESNKQLNSSFQKFYKEHIRQERKDEWGGPYFYQIDQINGVHHFDYNNDNQKDVLVEFSAAPSDGGIWCFLTAVLFEYKKGAYLYKAHIITEEMIFTKYENSTFYFKGVPFKSLLDENRAKAYKLVGNKFVETDDFQKDFFDSFFKDKK